jgi:hypothetical protein
MASPGHCIIGYLPEGPTYFSYAVRTTTGATPGTGNVSYLADAASDIDGDGKPNLWGVDVPVQNTPPPSGLTGRNGCAAIYDASGNPNVGGQIGPCAVGAGVSVF